MTTHLRSLLLLLAALLFAVPARADDHKLVELTSLRLLRDKGVITQAEYDSALRDLGDTVGAAAGDSTTVVVGKWSTTMYGFIEEDNIYDTTESYNDLAGNGLVARPSTYAGQNGRFTMGVRNSRLGFRLRAPEYHGVRASALLEMDFLGNQNQVGYTQAYQISEGAFFTNPSFRIRHFMLKVETPIVDVLVGQYWQLFGWQSSYHPNTVEIQGVLGQIYSRTVQLRLMKTLHAGPVNVELALAMMRPPQRDSATPEGQGGVRVSFDGWKGMQTMGSTGTTESPLSVAVTADVRHFSLPAFAAKPTSSVDKTGWGIAADGFVPILPIRHGDRGNTLSLNGEYAWGVGTADLYTGLSGGVGNAALPNPTMANPAPTYTPDADPALIDFAADGSAHLIQWQSYQVGLQYYFPRLAGRAWISANYGHVDSDNAKQHPASATTVPLDHADRFDVNLFGDVTPAVRLGVSYSFVRDTYADAVYADNHRVQLSAFYLF